MTATPPPFSEHAPLLDRLRGRAFLPGVHYAKQAEAWMHEAADEIDRLTQWKAEAQTVLDGMQAAWQRAGSPGPLGRPMADNMADEILRLRHLEPDDTRIAYVWQWSRLGHWTDVYRDPSGLRHELGRDPRPDSPPGTVEYRLVRRTITDTEIDPTSATSRPSPSSTRRPRP